MALEANPAAIDKMGRKFIKALNLLFHSRMISYSRMI